tara:strand:- start:336 stop:776 length:441 start_codon:yes stop_codon:yes gene_type:complete
MAAAALIKSAVDGVKASINTAKDISDIAGDIDKLFAGQQQVQREKQKKQSSLLGISSVASDIIDEKLAREAEQEIKTLVNMRFGSNTWARIVAERSRRIAAFKEAEREAARKKAERVENIILTVAIIVGLVVVIGGFAAAYWWHNH